MMPTREPRAYDTDVACGSGRRANESEVNSEVPLVHADRRRSVCDDCIVCMYMCSASDARASTRRVSSREIDSALPLDAHAGKRYTNTLLLPCEALRYTYSSNGISFPLVLSRSVCTLRPQARLESTQHLTSHVTTPRSSRHRGKTKLNFDRCTFDEIDRENRVK